MRKNKDELLVEYLKNEGQKMGMSAVEYALSEYYSSEEFEKLFGTKEYMSDYIKEYYPDHKDYWKERRDKTRGKFVYLLLNVKDEVTYVGSSTEIYNRLCVHKSYGRKFDKVMLYDFSDCNINDKQLRTYEYFEQSIYKKHLDSDCRVSPYNEEELKEVQEQVGDIQPVILRDFSLASILEALGRK